LLKVTRRESRRNGGVRWHVVGRVLKLIGAASCAAPEKPSSRRCSGPNPGGRRLRLGQAGGDGGLKSLGGRHPMSDDVAGNLVLGGLGTNVLAKVSSGIHDAAFPARTEAFRSDIEFFPALDDLSPELMVVAKDQVHAVGVATVHQGPLVDSFD